MYGIGAVELLILIALALVLFGAPVLTFIVGYAMGKRSSGDTAAATDAATTGSTAAATAEDAPQRANVTDDGSAEE